MSLLKEVLKKAHSRHLLCAFYCERVNLNAMVISVFFNDCYAEIDQHLLLNESVHKRIRCNTVRRRIELTQ